MKNSFLKENLTLTTFTKFLNNEKKKKNGKSFTIGDVQGYIRKKRLPKYLGGNYILIDNEIDGVTLYNILS